MQQTWGRTSINLVCVSVTDQRSFTLTINFTVLYEVCSVVKHENDMTFLMADFHNYLQYQQYILCIIIICVSVCCICSYVSGVIHHILLLCQGEAHKINDIQS